MDTHAAPSTVPSEFLRRSRLVEWATADQNARWVEHRLASEGDPRWRVRRLGQASVVAGPRDAVFNTSIGLGLDGPVSEADIDAAVGVFREAGAVPALELSPFADAGLFHSLARRGFVFDRCYQAYLLDLRVQGAWDGPGQLASARVERVDTSDSEQREQAVHTIARGFERRDPEGNGLDAARLGVEAPSSAVFLAWSGDKEAGDDAAGGGCAGISEVEGQRVAYLFGTSVRPEFRRRGLHGAIVQSRLAWAARSGASFACVDSVPGLWTERTVRRLGFELLYTKPVLVLPDAA